MTYDIPESMKEVMVKYCYDKMKEINPKFLKDNEIKPNLFMEVLYIKSQENYIKKGDFTLEDLELQQVFLYVKNTENIMKGFVTGKHELVGISGEDNLIFKIQRLIGNNNE